MAQPSRRQFVLTAMSAAAAAKPRPQLSVFPYGAVQLLDSPLKRQFDENHAFFLNLNEDRMLKIYRQRAGLPAPGEDMGGWYDDFCPGAHFGQYLSALARFAAITRSEPTAEKVRRLVKDLAQTMDPSGRFFVDHRYPGYTYDKLVIGLLDAHSWVGDRNALPTLYATTRAVRPHMADHALTFEEQQQRPHKDETYTWDETYTMAENLFLAWERTGDRMFFDMAKRYLLDRTFFDPLAEGQNILPGLHAYSHVNALSSGIQGYIKTGDAKYRRAVTNAVELIWQHQSFATGGWGPNETFVEPGKGQLGASLNGTHRHFETPCGAYAHFKVMRYLLALTHDPRYGDSMERTLYNTVLGALPLREDGSAFYYSDYHPDARKTYRQPIEDSKYRWDHDARWPCCSGTLPQVVADYGISAYLRSDEGVYVNLYVPSTLRWREGSLTVRTDYPNADLVSIELQPLSRIEFSVHLRIPAWAGPATSVSINGRRERIALQPGTFVRLRRTWRPGDRLDLDLDQLIRTEPVDAQTPDRVALLRGPQVLFAISDRQPELRGTKPDRSIPLKPFAEIPARIAYQTYWKPVL